MPLHARCDHVVHVHLFSRDEELSRTCAALLAQHFAGQEAETSSEPGLVEVRSSPDAAVTAADVAQAPVAVQVRAPTVRTIVTSSDTASRWTSTRFALSPARARHEAAVCLTCIGAVVAARQPRLVRLPEPLLWAAFVGGLTAYLAQRRRVCE